MSEMSKLHMIIMDAIDVGLSDESIIELMVGEGLPRGACSEILRVLKEVE
jgi:hypothetical protein